MQKVAFMKYDMIHSCAISAEMPSLRTMLWLWGTFLIFRFTPSFKSNVFGWQWSFFRETEKILRSPGIPRETIWIATLRKHRICPKKAQQFSYIEHYYNMYAIFQEFSFLVHIYIEFMHVLVFSLYIPHKRHIETVCTHCKQLVHSFAFRNVHRVHLNWELFKIKVI